MRDWVFNYLSIRASNCAVAQAGCASVRVLSCTYVIRASTRNLSPLRPRNPENLGPAQIVSRKWWRLGNVVVWDEQWCGSVITTIVPVITKCWLTNWTVILYKLGVRGRGLGRLPTVFKTVFIRFKLTLYWITVPLLKYYFLK